MTPPTVARATQSEQAPFAVLGRLLGAGGDTGIGDVIGAVVVSGGRIIAVEAPADTARLPALRFQAAFVAPGFIDLQINGGFGFEVGEDPGALRALAARLPATGVTSFLPTLVSRNEAAYRRAFTSHAAASGHPDPAAATMLGIHLEGPLLSPARAGAHERAAIEGADAALVERLADPACVRLVTLAPERPGARDLIATLVARGIVVSLGHTDASFDAFTAGVDAGATLATHVFNAMSPLHHREPGAVGAPLTDDRVIATIVADGVHTHPAVFRLVARAKGADRLALVTDAVQGAGGPPGPSALAGREITVDERAARLPDGTLAGSVLTMERAVRNAVDFADLSPQAAVHLATAVPARALGLGGKGRLTVGADADIVLLDQSLRVVHTFVGGVLAHSREHA
ncbi:MAG: N-acetylglucosamine-6-phosphate deacetylase [Bacteroidota bacterium]